ncbi:MAG: FKBP-type peptidyl-prolyl cis-trans isomerase [Sphingomonas sp.]|nr:FKBP-type peptidyl-prolyl cis-trans isomerase [Sphingomonas sp.]
MSVTAVPIRPTRRGVLGMLWAGITVAVAAAIWLAVVGTAPVVGLKGSNEQFLAYNRTRAGVIETESGLQYQILKKGADTKTPTDTDVAAVTYIGRLRDGTVFDASQQPVPFPLSKGAIKGFLEGLKLMPKGAQYRFWMKPELAYGASSPDPNKIPPDSILVFDVNMVAFISQQQFEQIQMQQRLQQQLGQGGGAPGQAPPGVQ